MDKIFLDTRESDSEFVNLFISEARKQNYNVEILALPIGDLQYQNIIIERKEINDMYSSIIDNRLWDQIANMRNNPDYACIIALSGRIQDLWNVDDTKIDVLMGSQKRIMAMGMPLMWCSGDRELIIRSLDLFNYASPIDKPIKRIQKNSSMSIIRAIPGIGIKNGKILKEKYKNVCGIVHCTEEELKKTIGPAKGSKVFAALRE